MGYKEIANGLAADSDFGHGLSTLGDPFVNHDGAIVNRQPWRDGRAMLNEQG
jgi:hypothetical protein